MSKKQIDIIANEWKRWYCLRIDIVLNKTYNHGLEKNTIQEWIS